MKKIIIVLGPPGSGKGTQAKKIAAARGYKHISTGDLLRALTVKEQLTDEERRAAEAVRAGNLVADALIYKLAFQEIAESVDQGQGVVLDGAIRSVAQAEAYQHFFDERGYTDEVMVIDILLSDEESLERLAARRVCGECGEIIPAAYRGAACPQCGAVLTKRRDDEETTIRERITVQGNQALTPIRAWYRERGLVREIDGRPPIETVAEAIKKVL